jgi:hypothetical protein
MPGGQGHDPPAIYAQQEMFAPTQPFRFYPLDFGLAFGVAATVFMLIAMLVAVAGNHADRLKFFQMLFPGFNPDAGITMLMGLVWSFVYGFVAGFFMGLLYNWRISRRYRAEPQQ